MPSLTHEEFLAIAPFLDMAERLGSFLGQVTDGNVESMQLAYNGSLAAQKTELLRNAAIAGVLGTSQSVNRINAAGSRNGAASASPRTRTRPAQRPSRSRCTPAPVLAAPPAPCCTATHRGC
jgi:hypothetical protein